MATKTYKAPTFVYGKNDKSLPKSLSYSLKTASPMDARAVLTSWTDLASIGQAAYVGMTFYIKEGIDASAGQFYIITAVPDPSGYTDSTWTFDTLEGAKESGFEFLTIGEDTDTQYAFKGANGVSVSVSPEKVDGKYEVTISHDIDSVYVVKGSKSIDEINALEAAEKKVGDVWNITDADGFYLGSDSGASTAGIGVLISKTAYDSLPEESKANYKHYPAYSNVVYTADGWDSLGGKITDITTTSKTASYGTTVDKPILTVSVNGLVDKEDTALSVSIDMEELSNELSNSITINSGSISVAGEHVTSGNAELSISNGSISGSITVNVEDFSITGGESSTTVASDSGLTGDITISIDEKGVPTINNTLKADVNSITPKWIWLCSGGSQDPQP